MSNFPHRYHATANGGPAGEIPVDSPGLTPLTTTAPPEFDGPQGYWSPETMLTASVANCYILTFRSIATRAKFEWQALRVDVVGVLDKTPEGLRFERFDLNITLTTAGSDRNDEAEKLLKNAKKYCLVTASLNADVAMTTEIVVG